MRKLRAEQKDRQQENSRPRDERNGGGADIAGTCDKADAAGEKGKTNEVDSEELKKAAEKIFSSHPQKMVLSSRRSSEAAYEKVVLSPRNIKNRMMYQAEQFTKTQVFHRNMDSAEALIFVVSLLRSDFKQLNSFSDEIEYNLKISKKGKIMLGKHLLKREDMANTEKRSDIPVRAGIQYRGSALSHNRRKRRLIEEGSVVEPLIDMGIFTKDGKIVRSMEDKFRQINRFLEIVDDAVETCGFEEIHVVDFGCGKAYLTFILYYYLTYVKKIRAYMTGLDLKADVIRKCSEAAKKYGYEHLKFEVGDISVYQSDEPVDMVITLHACDTATDYALYHAVQWNSRVILSVPCCQHELNAQIESEGLSALTKYGLLKERFAALATDALRASLLEYSGYKTQVLEFVDFSHTPKNVLIRAVKSNIPPRKREKSLREVESLMEEFHADPALYRLLMQGRQMQDSFLQKRRGKQL